MHHHFPCIPLPPSLTGKKQLQHGEQVALLFANIPMMRLQVYFSSPIAKVSILPRPRIAPINQHGSIIHPSIFCGSSCSNFCRSLPDTCYAVVRHLCVLGGASVGFASLFTKPSKVSGNVYERIANAAHRASYQPDRGRILLAGSVEAGT